MGFRRRPVLAVLFLFTLLISGRQLSSPDLGWHLAAGERIVREGRIPHADDFSHTVAGAHWNGAFRLFTCAQLPAISHTSPASMEI